MYRALTLKAIRLGVDAYDGVGLAALCQTDIRFTTRPTYRVGNQSISGRRMSAPRLDLRRWGVWCRSAAHPEVRERFVRLQRRIAAGGGVADGRDVGICSAGGRGKIF